MGRPSVDVVVPFRGSAAELEQLRGRLARLKLAPSDSVLVVDNTPGRRVVADGGSVPVMHAAERKTPGYARNHGAAAGSAPWIVFFDADTEQGEDVIDRYFEPAPGARTALLAGGVRDQPVAGGRHHTARYSYIRAAMSQDDTFRFGSWGFPKAANVAVRRAPFEALGGFRSDIRAAEDADLSYRLRAAGWEVERREPAGVVHRSRPTLRSFVVQKAMHGAGGAWLERLYPGAFPARRRLGLLWWALRTSARGLLLAAHSRDPDRALVAVFEPLEAVAFELGRSLPNERPLTPGVWWGAIRRLRRAGPGER